MPRGTISLEIHHFLWLVQLNSSQHNNSCRFPNARDVNLFCILLRLDFNFLESKAAPVFLLVFKIY